MKIIRHTDQDHDKALRFLNRRSLPPAELRQTVATILDEVRDRGDDAVFELTQRFDKADLRPTGLEISEREFQAAAKLATPELKTAVAATLENVRQFTRQSLRTPWHGTNAQGAQFGEAFHPLGRVGIYVPGGTAPLVSTALMTVPIAVEAGVPEIVVTTPCGADGSVNPALLYALSQAGATEVYKIGGAQAIAAMAFGTASIRPVEKIYGPGNTFVVEAKRQVFGYTGIDLLPGPSEILVLADDSARADWVAADMLAQAEHGKDSQVGLITNSRRLLDEVIAQLETQSATLSRQEPLRHVLEHGTFCILERSLTEAVNLTNAFAPEHLSLVVEDPESLLPEIRTAGAVYLGGLAPVAAGDFLAGPSHVLPTAGAGKAFPGLTAEMFQRRTSIVRFSQAAVNASAPIVQTFAQVEGLDAHGRSVSLRTSP